MNTRRHSRLAIDLRALLVNSQITFASPVGDRGALVLDDAYLWSTNDDAAASILDGDNEVFESTGALVCSDCQVKQCVKRCSAAYADPNRINNMIIMPGLIFGINHGTNCFKNTKFFERLRLPVIPGR